MSEGVATLGAHPAGSTGVLPGLPGRPATQPPEYPGCPDMAVPGEPFVLGDRSGGCLVTKPEPAVPLRGEMKSEVLGPCPQALSTAWEGSGHTGFRSLVSG